MVIFLLRSYATVFIVEVKNYEFTPMNILNVHIGDTIRWSWVNGNHTTTCDPNEQEGTSLPAGAATWSASLSSNNKTFEYTVTTAGVYTYMCIPHAPDMYGTFTVAAVTPMPPVITSHPSSFAACAGTIVPFNASATSCCGTTVQWQVSMNNGGMWADIPGATNNTYQHTVLPPENNYLYRAVFSNTANPSLKTATNPGSLTVIANGTWLGVSDNLWSNPANWCGGVPTASTPVVIPASSPNSPTIVSGIYSCASVMLGAGKTININPQARLNVGP